MEVNLDGKLGGLFPEDLQLCKVYEHYRTGTYYLVEVGLTFFLRTDHLTTLCLLEQGPGLPYDVLHHANSISDVNTSVSLKG